MNEQFNKNNDSKYTSDNIKFDQNQNDLSSQSNDNVSILNNDTTDDDIKSIIGEEPIINFDKHVDPNFIDSVMPDAAEIIKPKFKHISG